MFEFDPRTWMILSYAAFNIVSFLAFGIDKWRARRGSWRISEAGLLALALLGPFGAYAGMRLFHHKTRKRRFLLVPFFLALHIIGLALLYYLKYLG